MFVLCPHCQFLVTLDPASGQPPSRCPRCDEFLQTPPAETMSDNAPASVAATSELDDAHPPSREVVADAFAASAEPVAPAPEPALASEAEPEPEPDVAVNGPGPASQPADTPRVARKRAPGFVRSSGRETPPSATRDRWRAAATIAGLSALLALQILLADRAQLSTNARWRPALSLLCGALHCALPPWREPEAFTLLERDVRPQPDVPGVLRVTASFRNDARWTQPWPSLLLTLSDVDGRVAGTRLFAPRDYLGRAATPDGLASGQSASIVMEVREPTPPVVAFTFDFR